MIDILDIRQEMIKLMVNKYAGKELSTKELNKFYKYLNLEFKNNNSKNNLDNRLNSFYKIIQKQYDDFIKLNDIITQLD
ncbi:MAG: hypothetical protein IJ565_02975 [Bacilli bacterium]|nr:hypothetical protein [Bacilli bacterium]